MKKILSILTIMLLALIGTAFAEENVSAGYTPDDKIMYNFDTFGEWASLNFAKLQGEEKYDLKEREILQEKLAEYKLVKQETRIEFKEKIDLKIQERKDRQVKKSEELKLKIKDENITKEIKLEIETKIEEIENEFEEIESDLNEFEEKEREQVREQEKETKELNKELSRFEIENKELLGKYESLLKDFDGKTFQITTDKREIFGKVENGTLRFSQNLENVDYLIKVKDEDKLREQIRDKDFSYTELENNVEMPISLKTKLAFNIATTE